MALLIAERDVQKSILEIMLKTVYLPGNLDDMVPLSRGGGGGGGGGQPSGMGGMKQEAYGGVSSGGGGGGGVPRPSSDTVVVRNLPPDCNWQILREGFAHCGEIKYAEMKDRGAGMIRFMQERDANKAVCKSHNFQTL